MFCYFFVDFFTHLSEHKQRPSSDQMSFVVSRLCFKNIENPKEINTFYQHHEKIITKVGNPEIEPMEQKKKMLRIDTQYHTTYIFSVPLFIIL
jgi:hypothetical protein